MLESQRQRPGHLPRQVDRQRARFRASASEFSELLDLQRRTRPADEPDRSRRGRVRWPSSAGKSPTGCSARVDPLEKIIQIEGVHFRVVGVSPKRGSFLGQSQDDFAVIPLGQFQKIFGSRRQLSTDRQAARPRSDRDRRWTTRRWRCASRGGSSRSSPTTSACSRRTRSSTSTTRRRTASSRCWSASSRCRWSSAASSS